MNALVAPIVLAVTAMLSVPVGFTENLGGTLANSKPTGSILTGVPREWSRGREYLSVGFIPNETVVEPSEPTFAIREFRERHLDIRANEKATLCSGTIPAWKVIYRSQVGPGTFVEATVYYTSVRGDAYSVAYVRPAGKDALDAEQFVQGFCGYSAEELRVLESRG